MPRSPLLAAFAILLAGCAGSNPPQPQADSDVVRVEEAFLTVRDTTDNVDSPAVWHGPDGEHWLLATAKEGNTIVVYDAATGALVRPVGEGGTDGSSLARPNGLAVVDDLMLVVERDNRRVQVFALPSFEPLGTLGTERMRRPYGLSVFPAGTFRYEPEGIELYACSEDAGYWITTDQDASTTGSTSSTG